MVVVVVLSVAMGGRTFGCPVCETETGQQVREQIFGANFGITVLKVMAPAPLIVFSILVVTRWLGKEEKSYDKS